MTRELLVQQGAGGRIRVFGLGEFAPVAQLAQARQERDALAAQVAALRSAARSAYAEWKQSGDVFGGMQELMQAADATTYKRGKP